MFILCRTKILYQAEKCLLWINTLAQLSLALKTFWLSLVLRANKLEPFEKNQTFQSQNVLNMERLRILDKASNPSLVETLQLICLEHCCSHNIRHGFKCKIRTKTLAYLSLSWLNAVVITVAFSIRINTLSYLSNLFIYLSIYLLLFFGFKILYFYLFSKYNKNN